MIERRSLLKGAAWSVPLIAVAVGAPAASASDCAGTVWTYIPDPNDQNNRVRMDVDIDNGYFYATYLKPVDSIDINVSNVPNFHPNRAAVVGETIAVFFGKCIDPESIQVHGNNIHYRHAGVFGN